MVSWNVDPAIIPDKSIIQFHATIVVERSGDDVVPEMGIPGGSLHLLMGFFNGWHDHGPEVFWG